MVSCGCHVSVRWLNAPRCGADVVPVCLHEVQAGLEQFVVTPAMLPSSSPVQLNTSDPTFKAVAPGMAAKYPDVGYVATRP